jgi:regulator of protease activity HflC (stomatin/prohibitin superfamily)
MLSFYLLAAVVLVAVVLVVRTFKVVKEYERGVKFMLGQFVKVMEPGLGTVIPLIQSWERVDMRVKAVDVPRQESITRDNVTVEIDAVIYYQVRDAEKAILEVEEYMYATQQLAQTTMRNIVGEVDLDALLAERERISQQIREIIGHHPGGEHEAGDRPAGRGRAGAPRRHHSGGGGAGGGPEHGRRGEHAQRRRGGAPPPHPANAQQP